MGDIPAQPGKYYHLGKLRFEHQPDGCWGVCNRMLGVGGYRTPFGAWLGLRRLARRGWYASGGVVPRSTDGSVEHIRQGIDYIRTQYGKQT